MINITIYNPSFSEGGTVILFANLAKYIIDTKTADVSVIDFQDGFTFKFLDKENCAFSKLFYNDKEIIIVEPTIFIINSLSSKLLGEKIFLNNNSLINLYTTYIYDMFKFIPFYFLFNNTTNKTKQLFSKFLFSNKFNNVKAFIEYADANNGIVFMDEITMKTTKEIFDISKINHIIPLFTRKYIIPSITRSNHAITRLYWLGRLADFKYMAVCSLINVLVDINSEKKYELNLIGDGARLDDIKKFANNRGISVKFHGHLSENAIVLELKENCDIAIGHGMSILMTASLKIPSIVLDGCYRVFESTETKANWIQNVNPGYVGEVINNSIDFKGELLKDILIKDYNFENYGEQAFLHWNNYHSIQAIAPEYLKLILSSKLLYSDFKKFNLNLPKIIIKVRDLFKPVFYKLIGAR